MRLYLLFLLIGYLVAATTSDSYAEEASFLDRPVNSINYKVESYQDMADTVRIASGKPVAFSELLQKWVDTRSTLSCRTYGHENKEPPTPLHQYLDGIVWHHGVTWRYDEKEDSIILDLPWIRPNPRSAKKLLSYILKNRPPAIDYRLGPKIADDDWRKAFDGLLCKKMNLDRIWKLRATADTQGGGFLPPVVDNLIASAIHGENGEEFAIIVNRQRIRDIPGEGSASYYLFNLEGKFLAGGIFSTGWRCTDVTGDLLEDGMTVQIDGRFNGREDLFQEFRVRDGHLVFVSGTFAGKFAATDLDGFHANWFFFRTDQDKFPEVALQKKPLVHSSGFYSFLDSTKDFTRLEHVPEAEPAGIYRLTP